MSGLEFASSLVSALVWPTVVGILVVLLRKQLRQAVDAASKKFDDITEVRAGTGGLIFKLENKTKEIAETTGAAKESAEAAKGEAAPRELQAGADQVINAGAIESMAAVGNPTVRAESETIHRRLGEEDPRAAILLAYIELEGFIKQIYDLKLRGDENIVDDFGGMVGALGAKNILQDGLAESTIGLQEVRNSVYDQKPEEVSAVLAESYRASVDNIIAYVLLQIGGSCD
jgi:hypothetical protein